MQHNLHKPDPFQPMHEYYGRELTPMEHQEVITNITGFFSLLAEWQAEQSLPLKQQEPSTHESTQPQQKRKTA